MSSKIIRCEEIVPDPILITLNSIEVDMTKVSAYNSIRMLKLIAEVDNGAPDPVQAWDIIIDIVQEQNPDISEEDIIKAGTEPQLGAFISAITVHSLRIHKPLEAVISPSFRLPGKRQAKEQSTSTK